MTNSQSPQRPDLQDLVAYIQGRGTETLRAQVLKRLDEDEAYMDLMIDLVPMLREAGECVDPDAEAEPAPAPLRLVAPAVPSAPAVAIPPAGGKVIAAPERFRRHPGLIAAAAIIPIAVAFWIIGLDRSSTHELVAEHLGATKFPGPLDDPLYKGTRGDRKGLSEESKKNLFVSGARLLDLELAIQEKNAEEAIDRLGHFKGTLEKDEAIFLQGVEAALNKSTADKWPDVQRALDEAYEDLFYDKAWQLYLAQGSCVRGAWLAARAGDTKFVKGPKVRNRCQEIVGPLWSANETTLREMLDRQTVDPEPEQ